MSPSTGKYIVLEGIDGAGKTTHLRLLQQWLIDLGVAVHLAKEPSTGLLGQLARKIMSEHIQLGQHPLALLFAADSLHHQTTPGGINSQLELGKFVLSDRSFYSTYAYQMPDCELEWLEDLHKYCTRPDLLLFIDISPQDAMRRLEVSRGANLELFEKVDELSRVREQYFRILELLRSQGKNVKSVQVQLDTSEAEVQSKIRQIVQDLIDPTL